MSSSMRRAAVAAIVKSQPQATAEDYKQHLLSELFGSNVFGDQAMRDRLPKESYEALQRSIHESHELDPMIADLVANAMKDWAIERGATHYTHWFQPMTGLTAEKHDSFINFSGENLLLEFSGKELIKGEPDASSFPSGGLRSTFEARGYTAWDPTSPAFIREGVNGATLCIPTAFCSWTGEALDMRTPLLRSAESLDKAASRMLRLLGDQKTKAVNATLGAEQEFFLVDRNFFLARPDLVATGRTVIGARPPKGQELEDHYFGSISPRVLAFMNDVERRLWALGVPCKTRHNEVAPSQFEMAPIFTRATLASDHNMLTMEILRQAASEHELVCLLHEKPFAGINGSGKHNNWSMSTDQGDNLLDPGHTPAENARFIIFLTAVIRAVDVHADLLRFSVASAGNDHRLGANEAPPAIISIYLGEELDSVVQSLIDGTAPVGANERGGKMQLGVSSLPPLPRDTTDRNRTSPFAFTGNKFEFRAAASSQSLGYPNIVLNTIVAESLNQLADEIEAAKGEEGDFKTAMQKVIKETLARHRRVCFLGDNYADSWPIEAEKRGMPNLKDTVSAIGALGDSKSIELFRSLEVFSEAEVHSRRNIAYEGYCKAIAIESQSCLGLASTAVLTCALQQQDRMASALNAAARTSAKLDLTRQERSLESFVDLVNQLIQATEELQAASEKAEAFEEDLAEKAALYRDEVVPAMDRTREVCDALETRVGDDLWPLPKYREMLFIH